jgi:hypothetical protein
MLPLPSFLLLSLAVYLCLSTCSNLALRPQLRSMFATLCGDETPMVRRAACGNFGALATSVAPADLREELWSVFTKLTQDPQDSVRLHTVTSSVVVARVVADSAEMLLPLFLRLCADSSWRVRYKVATDFTELCAAVGGEKCSQIEALVEGYVRLLQDGAAEVRTAAAYKVGDVAKLVGGQVQRSLSSFVLLLLFLSPAPRSTSFSHTSSIKGEQSQVDGAGPDAGPGRMPAHARRAGVDRDGHGQGNTNYE